MFTHKSTLIVVLILLTSFCFGQSNPANPSEIAFQEIEKLKNGYLLFRIENYGKAIEELEKRGNHKKVKELRTQAVKNVRDYLQEIPIGYSFSKFLFFYSSDANKLIKENDFSVLFDADKNKVSNLNVDLDKIFICTKERRSYTAFTLREDFHVFKLYNNRIQRLAKPFPTEMVVPPPKPWWAIWRKFKFDDEVFYMNSTLEDNFKKLK